MKLTFLSLLCLTSIFAQDSRDILNAKLSALANKILAVTITASQGDGGTCTIIKQGQGKIAAQISCISSDGKTSLNSEILRATGTTTTPFMVDFGDICGIVVANPTNAPVTLGSVGPIPANGIAWQFSTNIVVSGAVTGQTPLVSGSIVWP